VEPRIPVEEHDACGIGFVADLGGSASHRLIEYGLAAVGAMKHRGAIAADGRTGDGAGILCETPRAFFARELAAGGLRVTAGRLAAFCITLPRHGDAAGTVRALVEGAVRRVDIIPLRWRRPPVDERVLGEHARSTRPLFEQLLVDVGPGNVRQRMRTARALIESALRDARSEAVLLSASENTVVYKALLSSHELGAYFADLRDPLFASRFAIFHQRFSTNSAPAWRLVQPFSHIAHNGEINTITGNRAWLDARGVRRVSGASDSYDIDTAIEAMLGAGYRIDHAVDLLLAPAIVEADERLRAYYDAHLPTVEPWDGPAALVFSDGDIVGAALDSAGLRPMRWCRTASNLVLAASEAGVVDFGNDPVVKRGRLGPGGRLVARLATGELAETEGFRTERRESGDFRPLVGTWQITAEAQAVTAPVVDDAMLQRFGWKKEEVKDLVTVLAGGVEPVLSMGDDAALGFFERDLPVAAYLRQRFAQVTNPAIDPLRESFVFDMRSVVGAGENNGDVPSPRSIVMLESGILPERDFDALLSDTRLTTRRLSLAIGSATLAGRIDALAVEAVAAVQDGASLLVLDDREAVISVPTVLAVGAIHHELTRTGLRMAASIAATDGAARDAHGCAVLLAMGANVATPWLGERVAARDGDPKLYIRALRMGLLKILAKLGICTLRSYIGAQTFESLGLGRDVLERCFPGVRGHVPAVSFAALEEDVRGWFAKANDAAALSDRGSYRFRRDGLRRAFDPSVIKGLRAAAMNGDYAAYEKMSDAMEAREPLALRDLVIPQPLRSAVALDSVVEEHDILAQFVTAAMSLGSLAPEVHEVIAHAANRLGARSNSGEGGEHERRYRRGAESTRSRIKQVASARFGVGVRYLASADEIEIKVAQGSKPGEGGQIPGNKVTAEIAELRGAVEGQPLISPPPHHDIYSIEDLAELIYDLRRAAPQARIAVKLVSQSGIGYVACGVAKAGADAIHISGHDGGTGASPLSSIKHAGLPWELGLVETHHALLATGLRSRVRLRVDGGMKTGRDVVIAAMLGAEEFGFGSALLVALGCIYARQCHKNTCPVGIATQDLALRAKFKGTAEEAQTFLSFVARDVRRRLAAMGARTLSELRGRSDLLRVRPTEDLRLREIDLSEILRLPEEDEIERGEPLVTPHLDDAAGTQPILPIAPQDRAVGARLAAERVANILAGETMPPLDLRYRGTAGQSFGAFLTHDMRLTLEGDANDYVGKSMEGGSIVVLGHGNAHEPVVGNACFYGARGGHAYMRGSAGERFAVRNSGANLVVEGAGDHACEYMTAGTVVILGGVGRNVASGMSGGTLYLLATPDVVIDMGPTTCLSARLKANDGDVQHVRTLLEAHAELTGSAAARELLAAWPAAAEGFIRIGSA
jgi:glutamate synthase domain-containing protein 2/glutamate synthase domain-containing protein 1/glutamate synthase domain-containing protein 3